MANATFMKDQLFTVFVISHKMNFPGHQEKPNHPAL